jgi:DNA polymerase III gamma/tau subunit
MRLFEKYRPQTMADVIGNFPDVVTNPSPVYLFHGPSGSSKTTLSLIVAKAVGADEFDIRHVNASSKNSVDDVRELEETLLMSPMGNAHVVIMDEAHKLTTQAQEALNVMVENPRKGVYWIFCTTNPTKIIAPLRSRCTEVAFLPLTEKQLTGLLKKVIQAEGKSVSNEVVCVIAEHSEGNARTALNRLEAVMDMPTENAIGYLSTLGFTEEATPEVIELVRELFKGDNPRESVYSSNPWGRIYPLLVKFKGLNMEETIRATVCSYGISMMKGYNPRTVKILHLFSEPFFSSGFTGMFTAFARCYQ